MPRAFVAATRQVYVFPAVSPVTLTVVLDELLLPVTPPFDDLHVERRRLGANSISGTERERPS